MDAELNEWSIPRSIYELPSHSVFSYLNSSIDKRYYTLLGRIWIISERYVHHGPNRDQIYLNENLKIFSPEWEAFTTYYHLCQTCTDHIFFSELLSLVYGKLNDNLHYKETTSRLEIEGHSLTLIVLQNNVKCLQFPKYVLHEISSICCNQN